MVCGISSCLSSFCRKCGPLLRELWLSYSTGRVFPGPGLYLPGDSLRRSTTGGPGCLPGAHFSKWSAPSCPAPLHKAACSSSGRVRGRQPGSGRRDHRLMSGALAVTAFRRLGDSLGRRSGPGALGCGGATRVCGERCFQSTSWVTAGLQDPSALPGVIARGVPRPAPERALAAAWGSHPGSRRSARVRLCPWIASLNSQVGKDVWPQPALAASLPFSTSSKTCALGNGPSSLKQPDKVASLGLSSLMLLPAFAQYTALLLVQGSSPKALLLPLLTLPMRACLSSPGTDIA